MPRGSAPSAMRMPISFVRCVTTYATTPYRPTAARIRARQANAPRTNAEKRSRASERATTSSIELRLPILVARCRSPGLPGAPSPTRCSGFDRARSSTCNRGPGLLRERFVHLRRRGRFQAFLLDVADDPHDLAHVRGPRDVQPFADRVFVGKEAACHRLVDEHDRRARGRVLFRNQSPANQRDLHHAQVGRSHLEIVGGRSSHPWPVHRSDAHIGDARERDGCRDSHRLDARHVLQSIEQAAPRTGAVETARDRSARGRLMCHGEHAAED